MVENVKENKVKAKKEKKAVAPAIIVKAEHRPLAVRGNILEGIVISNKAMKTITVKRIITHYVPKYERYKKVVSKLKAHVPDGMVVKEGDKVRIGETRKISKTKNFVLLEVLTGKKEDKQ